MEKRYIEEIGKIKEILYKDLKQGIEEDEHEALCSALICMVAFLGMRWCMIFGYNVTEFIFNFLLSIFDNMDNDDIFLTKEKKLDLVNRIFDAFSSVVNLLESNNSTAETEVHAMEILLEKVWTNVNMIVISLLNDDLVTPAFIVRSVKKVYTTIMNEELEFLLPQQGETGTVH